MKKSLLNIIGLLVIAFGFISCRDDDKDPWKDFTTPNGAIILLDAVTVPVFDVTDIDNATYEASLRDPGGNVASYALQVNLNGGDFFDLTTITSFPHSLVVRATDVATAIGVTTAELTAGSAIQFRATITRNDGTVFTKDDLGDDLFGNPGQRQGYEYTTFVSCPFSAAEAAGTYNQTRDDFGTFAGSGNGITAVADAGDDTRITFEDMFQHPNPATGANDYDVTVVVDASSGEATVTKQEAWHCDNFGCPYGVGSVETAGSGNFFFSCTGFLTVNLRHTVALGSFGIFKLNMQRQ